MELIRSIVNFLDGSVFARAHGADLFGTLLWVLISISMIWILMDGDDTHPGQQMLARVPFIRLLMALMAASWPVSLPLLVIAKAVLDHFNTPPRGPGLT